MADWDDEDFEVPTVFTETENVNKKFEDEEDLALAELEAGPEIAKPSEALAAANAKKAAAEEAKLAIQLEETLLENETEGERRARLKKTMEDADMENARDLFDGVGDSAAKSSPKKNTTAGGVGGMTVKSKQDHVNFAIQMSLKMQKSTPFCLAAFYTELNNRLAGNLDSKALTGMITMLTSLRDSKKEKEAATAAPPQKKKTTKKEKMDMRRKQAEMFGGDYDQTDVYDEQYGGMEDDFM